MNFNKLFNISSVWLHSGHDSAGADLWRFFLFNNFSFDTAWISPEPHEQEKNLFLGVLKPLNPRQALTTRVEDGYLAPEASVR